MTLDNILDIKIPYLKTKNNIIVDVNCSFEEFTDYTKEDLVKSSIQKVCIELLRVTINIDDIENKIDEKECFVFTKSYQVREVLISRLPMKDTNEEVVYFFREIPHSRLEDKFQYLYRLLLENIRGIAIYSPDFIILNANQTFLDSFDEPFNNKEYSIGQSLYRVVKNIKGSLFEENFVESVKTGNIYNTFEYETKTDPFKKGTTYWDISIVPIVENGKVKYLIQESSDVSDRVLHKKQIEENNNLIHGLDITEQINQSKVIEYQKKQLEAIVENMSDTLAVVDKDGNYNNLYKAKLDIENTEYLKKAGDSYEAGKYFDYKGNEILKENLPICKVARGEIVKNERVIIKSNNEIYHFEFSGTPIFDAEGNYEIGVICGWDVTEKVKFEELKKLHTDYALKKEIDERKILENAIQLKDEFLSIISHELKTPLTVINSAIQALENICRDEMSERAKRFLRNIKQNSFRQWRLVNNLLDITRLNAGRIKICNKNMDIVFLTKEIIESIRLYAQQKGVELTLTSSFELKIIGIDDEKYERILLNLLSNAIKYTPKGGRITVRLSSIKGHVKICIKDTGVGIPKDKQELIFERFGQVDSSLTRQAEGTGIGLYLVKMLVETLNGTISVKSKEGLGSMFIVLLPAIKVQDNKGDTISEVYLDNKLIQSVAIEFSDIYL